MVSQPLQLSNTSNHTTNTSFTYSAIKATKVKLLVSKLNPLLAFVFRIMETKLGEMNQPASTNTSKIKTHLSCGFVLFFGAAVAAAAPGSSPSRRGRTAAAALLSLVSAASAAAAPVLVLIPTRRGGRRGVLGRGMVTVFRRG